jgi:hypothetical protein
MSTATPEQVLEAIVDEINTGSLDAHIGFISTKGTLEVMSWIARQTGR